MSKAVELTAEEANDHKKAIANFRKQKARLDNRYDEGNITGKRYREKLSDLDGEEKFYMQTCGIFMYYGKLYKREK